jgi:hypothetical protein
VVRGRQALALTLAPPERASEEEKAWWMAADTMPAYT